jgi:manganese/zinc/iron transport system permease protein
MVADAISHSVFPGIVIAYMLSSSIDGFSMFIAASIVGVLTTFLIELLSQKVKVQQDASIGVVFTFLFSLGLICVSLFELNNELDPDHILYGEILNVPFDQLKIGGEFIGPRAVYILGLLNIIVVGVVTLFYRRLKLTSFDSSFAQLLGVNVMLWHYILMGMVSITAVGAFDIVGAILVIALLAIPPATAYLFTQRLNHMIFLSIFISIFGCVSGYYVSKLTNTSTSGAIVSVFGVIFVLSILLTPDRGILTKRLWSKKQSTSS